MMEELEDCSDEVDKDLEAMLYSQVHFEHDDTVDQETTKDTQFVFTVIPVRIDHSTVSSNSAVRSSTASVKQPSSLFETVPFDNEGAADLEKSGVDSAFVGIKHESGIQEAELGICEPSPKTKNSNKRKQNKDNVPVKPDPSLRTKKDHSKAKQDKGIPVRSSPLKFQKTEATVVIPDFIKIDKHSPRKETDYRKTLNRLLTKKSRSKEVKDVVIIKSDNSSISDTTTSSSSSESEPSSDDKICESSSLSDSESNIEILGNASARSVKKSALPKLDLNWNVTSADRLTIKRIEEGDSKSKWKIDDADLPASSSRLRGSRYYARNQIRCRNCDKEGHLARVCPVPKKKPNCGLCGEEGHLMQRCKNSLCFNCSQPGHRGASCPQPRRDRFALCIRCNTRGHEKDQCPDLWRQYHLTVTSSEDLTPKRKAVNLHVFCCNCAKQGHFAHECRRERMDKFNSPTNPFVMKYDCASSKGMKELSQTKSTDRESEHGPRAKMFKFDHHHSNTSEQSHGHQPLYPRGYGSGYRGKPVNQRYFDAQSSTRSMPHHHHTPSSHRLTHTSEKVGQKQHSTVGSDQQHGTPKQPYMSPFSKKFLQGFLQEDLGGKMGYNARHSGDQYFDWQGEQSSHHPQGQSRKRRSPSTWDNDGPTPPSKKRRGKKNKKRHTSQHDNTDKGWVKKNKERHTSQHDKGWAKKNKEQHTSQHDNTDKVWVKKNKERHTSQHDNTDKGWAKKNKERHTSQHDKGWAKDGKKQDKQQKKKTWGEHNQNHHTRQSPSQGQAENRKKGQHKSQHGKQKTSFPQPGTSNQQIESLTVTCRGGFRTAVRTMNFGKNP